jgi:hypothetical protein
MLAWEEKGMRGGGFVAAKGHRGSAEDLRVYRRPGTQGGAEYLLLGVGRGAHGRGRGIPGRRRT